MKSKHSFSNIHSICFQNLEKKKFSTHTIIGDGVSAIHSRNVSATSKYSFWLNMGCHEELTKISIRGCSNVSTITLYCCVFWGSYAVSTMNKYRHLLMSVCFVCNYSYLNRQFVSNFINRNQFHFKITAFSSHFFLKQ